MDTQAEEASWEPLRPQLSPEYLERALELLSRYYDFVTMDEVTAMLEGRLPLKPNCCAFTFDDGYRNNAIHALPKLQKYGAPAVFYIATGHTDEQRPFWVDRLDYALQFADINGKTIRHEDTEITIDNSSRHALSKSFAQLRSILKHADMPDIEMRNYFDQLTESLETQSGRNLNQIIKNDPWSSILTWDEVASISHTDGIIVGSHTVNHVRLAQADADTIRKQLIRSKEAIERVTGESCRHFCYPNGSWNQQAVDILKETGYISAVTSDEGINNPGADPFKLKRISISGKKDPLFLLASTCGLSR
ncbi:MAG: polysaccharide deacetylase family protein [gamma proteobacterium endosymbiont of Lamellibrachia anaximandri]|nr:polysaccharide deacetylase family protein [gamma proteobacterium endosymbiont of Lamellibrachia anaximandri]MBL3617467.1 polysaccharide deacetylase family protein [gamma proteobacterium endosymbiont of Lamellibrachia anaximandri]